MRQLTDEENRRLARYVIQFLAVKDAIHAVCASGRYDERPPVECPACGANSVHYSCAWDGNKHIAFRCICGFEVIE